MEGAGGSDTSSSCSSSSSSSSCCSTGGLAEGEAISPSAAAAGRGDATQLSPWLASPLSLYLIRLRLLREAHFTLSPKELLTLFQLAGARRAASLKPLETVSPLFVPTETLALPQPPTGERGGGGPGGPTTQLDAKRLQRRSRGQQSFRVDPLDVSLLLVSGELSWSDLPLLEDLEETAAAAEAALQQRERRWWGGWWPSLLLGSRRRGDIWREAAARLQGRGRPCAAAPSPLSLGLKKKASTSHEVEAGPPPSSLLPNAASVGTADLLGLNEETAVGAFAVPSLTAAASSRGNRLNQRPSSAPTPVPAAAAAAAERGLVGSRSPGGDSSGHLRYGPSAWSRPLEETGGEGGEVAFKAAAATVSRMGNEALALLPHGCQWPWAANSRAPAAAVSGLSSASVTSSSCLFQGAPQHPTVPGWGPAEGPLGGLSAASGCGGGGGPLAAGPLAQADTWRASVGLRLRRESRPGGRRRREARGLRQKLSPLDPPYDAYSLYLHPFSCVGAGELPDAEASRAAEVNEVCLDFLGRSRGADSCSSCGQLFAVSGDTAKDRGKEAHKRRPCCLSHHCLHYTKVGDGREKVVLIHGICMSGYFFADLIRFLVPDSPSQGGDDPHESWRFTVYCVDLLGYGKSSSVPSSHSYSRREQAEAILRDVILANGFTSVHLVGHSFGGLVAAELCEMLPPGFVTTLILLAPAYFESERQAVRILTALHFPASHTIAHPYFGEFLLRLGVVLRPLFEPLVLSIVPKGELPQLSVADVFCIHPDALTGTIRSIVQDRVDRTFQLLRQRGQRASLFHGTKDGVIPIRQARFLALRYPNIHVRALSGFVHHFPASHAQFTAHIIKQVNAGETKSVGRDGRRLTWENDQKRQNDKIGPRATRLVETKAETSQAALRGDSRLTEGARCGSQIARCA